MKKIYLLFILFASSFCSAQQVWQKLDAAPVMSFRHDDVYFADESRGWVVNTSGSIWRTYDGGLTWAKQIQQNTAFRCVAFFDSLNGVVGNLGPGAAWTRFADTIPLYRTGDGGKTWAPVTAISGDIPAGVCGMRRINDSTVYAVGRILGPTFFLKTTDKGNSWQTVALGQLSSSLVDLHFSSPDTGFAIGCFPVDSVNYKAVILRTVDAGNTWNHHYVLHAATIDHNCGWKIDFPSKKVGYVSVQTTRDSVYILKTLDGGATWQHQLISTSSYDIQGIGFVNDTTGWYGGGGTFYETRDGGQTWNPGPVMLNVNRIHVISDTLAYAVGKTIYKYSTPRVNSVQPEPSTEGYALHQNFPNPFCKSTTVRYTIPKGEKVLIEVFDLPGQKIKTLVNEFKPAGTHEVVLTLPNPVSGQLICCMNAGAAFRSIWIVSVR